ncbi:centrosomal protein of 19 kDa-like [Mytilus trossulus]|uniref:centrosomal protein of 19 kDa-like n=1 Tax=Mytilus trossulus TaxID=6551 RepID=UPI0030041764
MGEEIEVKKCGVKFKPPAIVVTYLLVETSKLHRRTMPLRSFTKNSDVSKAASDLRTHPRHGQFVKGLPKSQLERLICIIRDKLCGMSLEASLARNEEMQKIDSDEDLNKVDPELLARKKSVMEDTFEKNQKKPGDADFEYDLQVDFDNQIVETCEWDSEGSNEDF